MGKERKKTKAKPIPVIKLKKRVKSKPELTPEVKIEKELVKRKYQPQLKFVRLSMDATQEERNEITPRVASGELTLSYYAADGTKDYHYYIINKVKE